MKIVSTLTSQAIRMYRAGNIKQARVVWDNAVAIANLEQAKSIK